MNFCTKNFCKILCIVLQRSAVQSGMNPMADPIEHSFSDTEKIFQTKFEGQNIGFLFPKVKHLEKRF